MVGRWSVGSLVGSRIFGGRPTTYQPPTDHLFTVQLVHNYQGYFNKPRTTVFHSFDELVLFLTVFQTYVNAMNEKIKKQVGAALHFISMLRNPLVAKLCSFNALWFFSFSLQIAISNPFVFKHVSNLKVWLFTHCLLSFLSLLFTPFFSFFPSFFPPFPFFLCLLSSIPLYFLNVFCLLCLSVFFYSFLSSSFPPSLVTFPCPLSSFCSFLQVESFLSTLSLFLSLSLCLLLFFLYSSFPPSLFPFPFPPLLFLLFLPSS